MSLPVGSGDILPPQERDRGCDDPELLRDGEPDRQDHAGLAEEREGADHLERAPQREREVAEPAVQQARSEQHEAEAMYVTDAGASAMTRTNALLLSAKAVTRVAISPAVAAAVTAIRSAASTSTIASRVVLVTMVMSPGELLAWNQAPA